ncbi:MAG: DUF1826 domain-containing protein [Pseudomonadota bacterium]
MASRTLDRAVKRVLHPADLAPALEADKDGAIWQRKLPNRVCEWLNALPAHALPEGRFILRPAQVMACVETAFAQAGHAASPARTWLSEDAHRLAHSLTTDQPADLVRLRLEPVFDNACSKFHIDTVTSRLICTYRGPGTQITLVDAHAANAIDTDQILTVETGAPILLKGKQWPQAASVRLKHRSPPIEGTGHVRLLLVIEAVTADDFMPNYDTVFAP